MTRTRRPLPEDDAELERLSDGERSLLAQVWLSRAASERRVSDAFAVITGDLALLGAPGEVTALARRAVDDELHHHDLALHVAARCAGRDLTPPPPLALVVPAHPGASARLTATLHVLGHCAMNETFASAYLEASLELARAPLARAAVQTLLSDEIDHSRIGWAHLASLTEAERHELAPWLPSLLAANLAMWRAIPRPGAEAHGLVRHGLVPADTVERALFGAVRDVILPGFARFGLRLPALQPSPVAVCQPD
jgi:hypothetical protein